MKICIVSVAFCSNRYIKEFVNYYYSNGVDKIFLADNNYDEDLEDAISDFISIGFVELFDYRGIKENIDKVFYDEIYNQYKNEYL